MHISLFIPSLAGGGAERSMVVLANELSLIGYKVDFLIAVDLEQEFYLDTLNSNINIIRFKANRTLFSLNRYIQYLKIAKPNCIISTIKHSNIVSYFARLFGNKASTLIFREANTPSLEKTRSILYKFSLFFVKHIYRNVDYVVAVSQGVYNDLRSYYGISESKLKLIYTPTQIALVREKSKIDEPNTWLDDPNLKVIVSVGRLAPQKDYPTLIDAFSKIRCKENTRLIILGEGEKRGELEKQVIEYNLENFVSFIGFKENVFSYIRKADVFVLCSKYEGLPGVLIQALICGTPVVSSDCPSGPFEILDGGKFGKLFTVGDSGELASRLDEVLDGNFFSDYAEIDRYLAGLFSTEITMQKYKAIIES